MLVMSEHTKVDRLERMVYIASTIEFGNTLLEVPNDRNRIECITDTGVILVKARSESNDILVTAFVATVEKVSAMYHSAGYDHIPEYLYRRIIKNKVHVILQNMTEEERKKYLRKKGKRA